MTVEELQQATEAQLPELAGIWLAPVDVFLSDLLAKAELLDPQAFFGEVSRAFTEIPNLYGQLDKNALQEALEDTQGEAMAIPLEESPPITEEDASGNQN